MEEDEKYDEQFSEFRKSFIFGLCRLLGLCSVEIKHFDLKIGYFGLCLNNQDDLNGADKKLWTGGRTVVPVGAAARHWPGKAGRGPRLAALQHCTARTGCGAGSQHSLTVSKYLFLFGDIHS